MSELQDIRLRLGLSQMAMAKRLGTTQASVSRWEAHGAPEYIVLAARNVEREGEVPPTDEGRAA